MCVLIHLQNIIGLPTINLMMKKDAGNPLIIPLYTFHVTMSKRSLFLGCTPNITNQCIEVLHTVSVGHHFVRSESAIHHLAFPSFSVELLALTPCHGEHQCLSSKLAPPTRNQITKCLRRSQEFTSILI